MSVLLFDSSTGRERLIIRFGFYRETTRLSSYASIRLLDSGAVWPSLARVPSSWRLLLSPACVWWSFSVALVHTRRVMLARAGSCWHAPGHAGTRRCTSAHADSCCQAPLHVGTSRGMLVRTGSCWLVLMHVGTRLCILARVGAFRHPQMHVGTRRCTSTRAGACWRVLVGTYIAACWRVNVRGDASIEPEILNNADSNGRRRISNGLLTFDRRARRSPYFYSPPSGSSFTPLALSPRRRNPRQFCLLSTFASHSVLMCSLSLAISPAF